MTSATATTRHTGTDSTATAPALTTVTRIGVTGHRSIPASVLPGVRARMREHLSGGALEAFTCLAAGADQLFAEVALDNDVPVTAVIPGMDYEAHLDDDEARAGYRRILACCAHRLDLPPEPTHEQAYLAAGRWIVDHCDRLIAVWDGRPARGLGGTGDVVAYARRTGVPVSVLWEPDVHRGP
ncbi:hypothetical protein RKD27_006262 [Streptomyces sp. SAI-126]|uniref:hypothetical protein n=1 Tax=unclassified Streptomyces TaxID=2593676 RepID=UPI00235B3753|nr:hypothetical protein [Streptomyces sp. SAI-119]MDH6499664.1 hypothetical protein [Streptomyces sp. SAI-149]GLP70321.1 hypothetical protein TUSST3_69420 [Streptomyces sp. TUS-ST3]